MKEIGIFKIDKNMCSNCRKDEDCPQKYSINGNCLYGEKDLIKEKVPETFEELKELCKKLKEEDILVTNDCIDFRDLNFYKSGLICVPDSEYFSISTGRTPAQMWAIIKSLVGEE